MFFLDWYYATMSRRRKDYQKYLRVIIFEISHQETKPLKEQLQSLPMGVAIFVVELIYH